MKRFFIGLMPHTLNILIIDNYSGESVQKILSGKEMRTLYEQLELRIPDRLKKRHKGPSLKGVKL